MAVFVVSYDLRKSGQNYQGLYNRLAAWNAIRGLESVWFINWQTTAQTIRDDLLKQMDVNDGLFVAEIKEALAWNQMEGRSGQILVKWIESG